MIFSCLLVIQLNDAVSSPVPSRSYFELNPYLSWILWSHCSLAYFSWFEAAPISLALKLKTANCTKLLLQGFLAYVLRDFSFVPKISVVVLYSTTSSKCTNNDFWVSSLSFHFATDHLRSDVQLE